MRKKVTNDGIENKLFEFEDLKACPICGIPLNRYDYGQHVEWICQCIACRFMIRWNLGVVQLRVYDWHATINPKNKKTYWKKDHILKRYDEEINKAKRRMNNDVR